MKTVRPAAWTWVVAEAVSLGVAVIGATALSLIFVGGVGGPSFVPLVATTAVTTVAVALLLRTRHLSVLASLAPLLVVVVLVSTAVLTTIPGSTLHGWLAGTQLRAVRADLGGARLELRRFSTPLSATPGVVLLGALLCGLFAAASRLLLGVARSVGESGPRRRIALALLPTLSLVTLSCVLRPGPADLLVVAAFGALSAFSLSSSSQAGIVSDQRSSFSSFSGSSATVISVAAIAIGVVVGVPTLTTLGSGAASPGRGTGTGVTPRELSLTNALTEVQRNDANQTLFTARTPFATYWQVATLTDLVNGQWKPDRATQAALRGTQLPRSYAYLPTRSQGVYYATVTVSSLYGPLLPVPLNTIAVEAPGGAVVTDVGAVGDETMKRGEQYRAEVMRVPPASDITAPKFPNVLPLNQLLPLLAVPSLPARISTLARAITLPGSSPLAKAEELVNWFHSGRFRYSVNAPTSSGVGYAPLLSFLTTHRVGSCVDFASAFAVLARSLGLPTRLAVGFTAGQLLHNGEVAITGADAHEWPQVFLGPQDGWVSFEPTPSLPSGQLAPSNVIGPTGITMPTHLPGGNTTTVPTTPTTTPVSTTPTTKPPSPTARTRPSRSHRRSFPPPEVTTGVLLGAIALLIAGLSTFVWVVLRLLRRRRLLLNSPTLYLYARWRDVERSLRRAGVPRPVSQSPASHLDQLHRHIPRSAKPSGPELRDALEDARGLASVLEQAVYAEGTITPTLAAEVSSGADKTCRTLRKRSSRRTLLSCRFGTLEKEPTR